VTLNAHGYAPYSAKVAAWLETPIGTFDVGACCSRYVILREPVALPEGLRGTLCTSVDGEVSRAPIVIPDGSSGEEAKVVIRTVKEPAR
jgi:hypothetical protein